MMEEEQLPKQALEMPEEKLGVVARSEAALKGRHTLMRLGVLRPFRANGYPSYSFPGVSPWAVRCGPFRAGLQPHAGYQP